MMRRTQSNESLCRLEEQHPALQRFRHHSTPVVSCIGRRVRRPAFLVRVKTQESFTSRTRLQNAQTYGLNDSSIVRSTVISVISSPIKIDLAASWDATLAHSHQLYRASASSCVKAKALTVDKLPDLHQHVRPSSPPVMSGFEAHQRVGLHTCVGQV